MATEVRHRRGTSAQLAAAIPAQSELIHNVETNRIHVGDGSTAGGHALATLADVESRNIDTFLSISSTRIPPVVSYIQTAGYTDPGDGGGALYKRVSSEPSHAGKIQSADGAWWELSETTPSIKSFGARGDGVANDSPAFQSAYDYMKSRGGGKVVVPAVPHGQFYALNETVVFDQDCDFHLEGQGNPYIIDVSTNGSNTFYVGDQSVSKQRHIVMSDMRIWGSEAMLNGNGIFAQHAGLLRLERVSLYRHGLFGLGMENTWTLTAYDCNFGMNKEGGVHVAFAGGNNTLFNHCVFSEAPAGKSAITFEGASNDPHFNASIFSCDFENNYIGVRAKHTKALSINSCYFEGSAAYNFLLTDSCEGVSIVHNDFFGGRGGVPTGGAGRLDTCSGIVIEGNSLEFNASIEVHNCAEVRVGPNSITNLGVTFTGTTVKYEFEAFPEWIDYVATFSSQGGDASIGNGYSAAWYKRNGNTITIHGAIGFGSTTSYGSGGFRVLLPVPAKSRGGFLWMGPCAVSGSAYNRDIQVFTEGGASFVQFATASGVAVGATVPHTWTSGDTLRWQLTYECS